MVILRWPVNCFWPRGQHSRSACKGGVFRLHSAPVVLGGGAVILGSKERDAGSMLDMEDIRDRVRGAVWGALMGDALAMPTHWYYGGFPQIAQDYGRIQGYTKPVTNLQGSIMNKSDTGGGGRGGTQGSIVGDVINHGKKKYWARGQSFHYHCTLEAGENTLEAQLLLLLLKSVSACGGKFDADHFRSAYVSFMTTPGSHNDTYASTCHRMFFKNRQAGIDPKDCPDNDGHNVDTIDGLVLPIGAALATLNCEQGEALATVNSCVAVTRRSGELQEYAAALTGALRAMAFGGQSLPDAVQHTAKQVGAQLAAPRGGDPLTA